MMWYDRGPLYFPGEIPPTALVELPFEYDRARITFTPTEIGQDIPETLEIDADAGYLEITLGQTPIFVEPIP